MLCSLALFVNKIRFTKRSSLGPERLELGIRAYVQHHLGGMRYVSF